MTSTLLVPDAVVTMNDSLDVLTDTAVLVSGDTITGFVSGTDTFKFVSSAFNLDAWSGSSVGVLSLGTNFSIITSAYDGTDAGTNSEFTANDPSCACIVLPLITSYWLPWTTSGHSYEWKNSIAQL